MVLYLHNMSSWHFWTTLHFGRDGGMKELAAGLNPVLRNRTVHSTLLSAEIQGTLVQRIVCLQQRGLSLTRILVRRAACNLEYVNELKYYLMLRK